MQVMTFEAYFIKYDSDFNLLWAFSYGAEDPENGYNLAYDSINDLIYHSGFIGNIVDINSLERNNLTAEGGTRAFVAAYNTDGIVQFTCIWKLK